MNEEKYTIEKKSALPGMPGWKGYTLEELDFRIGVNRVKQQIVVGQISETIGGAKRRFSMARTMLGNFESAASIAEYAVIGYKVFQRLRTLWQTMKR